MNKQDQQALSAVVAAAVFPCQDIELPSNCGRGNYELKVKAYDIATDADYDLANTQRNPGAVPVRFVVKEDGEIGGATKLVFGRNRRIHKPSLRSVVDRLVDGVLKVKAGEVIDIVATDITNEEREARQRHRNHFSKRLYY